MAISDGFGISFGSKNISQGVPVTAVKSLSLSLTPSLSVLPPLKCGKLLIFSHQLFSHFKIDLNDASLSTPLMQHNVEDLVKMHTMRWMQDIVQLFKRRKKNLPHKFYF